MGIINLRQGPTHLHVEEKLGRSELGRQPSHACVNVGKLLVTSPLLLELVTPLTLPRLRLKHMLAGQTLRLAPPAVPPGAHSSLQSACGRHEQLQMMCLFRRIVTAPPPEAVPPLLRRHLGRAGFEDAAYEAEHRVQRRRQHRRI